MSKRILIIAGPNGAGKTTFAQEYLPNEAALPAFINADLIAAGLSPFNPAAVAVRAGRLMLAEIDDHVRRGESFAFETTLSGRGYVRRIEQWKRAGYRVELIFLSLPTPELAIKRVAVRVAQGGHDVSEETIRRRFRSGLRNFELLYKALADSWFLYDNRGDEPLLIDKATRDAC
jgi:predicted ABC-type ATPase